MFLSTIVVYLAFLILIGWFLCQLILIFLVILRDLNARLV